MRYDEWYWKIKSKEKLILKIKEKKMKKRTEGEIHQNQKTKNFNATLWFRMISVVLSVATVAVVCLGIGLFASNDKVAVLRADLSDVNEKYEALNAENREALSVIDSLQSGQALTAEDMEMLVSELAAIKEALTLSKTEQNSLENSLDALEKTNQSAQDEIDQLKSDIENAKGEIVTLKEQLKESEGKIRIYIDQGHNPAPHHNIGATGNGLYEQDVTFLIGCLLADLLKTDGRFEVQLSRPNKSVVLGTDNKSSLMARVEGAEAFNADYLISLHTNSFTEDTANGIEIYVAEKSSESYIFGESLLKGLIKSTNLRDRGMKLQPDFDILEYSSMPAALLELGFISNSGDAALLSEHPELFAQGIYGGILDYFGLMPNTPVAT